MKKVKGKALSLVLSLALVISSFSAIPASAASKTLSGSLGGSYDTDFYLVNGGTGDALVYSGFASAVCDQPTMTTERHEDVSDLKVASISHKSGDRLTKFYDAGNNDESIGSDTQIGDIALKLRSGTVSGEEVVSILYQGTYTDDDDKEYNVKATKDVTIRVYNKGETVIGAVGTKDGDEGELDDTFAQKTLAHEMDSTGAAATDSKDLTVLQAGPADANPIIVKWTGLSTVKYDDTSSDYLKSDSTNKTVDYVLKSSSDNITLTNDASTGSDASFTKIQAADTGKIGIAFNKDTKVLTFTAPTDDSTADIYYSIGSAVTPGVGDTVKGTSVTLTAADNGKTVYVAAYPTGTTATADATDSGVFTDAVSGSSSGFVTASVKDKAGTGNITLTAYATSYAKDNADLYSTSDVKEKTSITKKILVGTAMTTGDGYKHLGKLGTNTYIYSGTLENENTKKFKVNGYEVNFNDKTADLQVDDKANVTTISGTVASVSVSSGNVGTINVSNSGTTIVPQVTVSDAKVGNIDFDADGGKVIVDSSDASIGNVTDASEVDVNSGTTGSLSADKVDIKADDDEHSVSVGDITSPSVEIDSEDSKVTTGTIKASDVDSEFILHGQDVTVKGFDFDYRNASLSLEDFNGTVPAPVKADADGASISTEDVDDSVVVTGDANINSISVADESTMTFDGAVQVGSIDGSGTLVVGVDKLYVTSDASGVMLKLAGNFVKGDVAFTSVSDTVDADDMDTFGYTVAKSEGSAKDTFKVDTTELVGLTVAPATAEIAKGYSQTFTASAYAPGSAIPAGYKVEYSLDGDSDIFDVVDNGDGTATVTVSDYDEVFLEENSATLVAQLVDENGDVDEDYAEGTVDLNALKVPTATYSSDTGKTLSIGGGFTYQFAVTSLDGNVPSFVVAGSSFKVAQAGTSGNTYYYKVTAVGKVGDAAGVYINHEAAPSTVITITNPSDTAAVTVKAGGSYQFRVNGPSQPVFQVAGIGNIALTSKAGSNYYFKVNVPTNLAKGGHGVYNNGVLVAILTVA